MGISYNPSVAGDGLVFYYDMANTQKSWKGKPTTNMIPQSTAQFENTSAFSTNDNPGPVTREILVGGGYSGRNAVKIEKGAAASSGYFQVEMSFPGTVTAGQTFTASIKYKRQDDSTYFYIGDWAGPDGNNPGWTQILDTAIDNGWRLRVVQVTYTNANAIYGGFTFGVNSTAPGKWIIFSDFQLENGIPWSSFTVGTRSNTQAILDLVGNKTITANSLTYNSDNTFSFNGAGQKLNVSNLSSFGNNATWMAWIKCTNGSASAYNMFMGRYLPYFSFYGGNSLYFSNMIGSTQQTIQTPSNLSANTWYHAAFTTSYNGANTTMKIYTNGVETANSTFVGAQGYEGSFNFAVGDGEPNNWYRFNGNVPTVQVYNRTLSDTEVYNNFIALKSRYGL